MHGIVDGSAAGIRDGHGVSLRDGMGMAVAQGDLDIDLCPHGVQASAATGTMSGPEQSAPWFLG